METFPNRVEAGRALAKRLAAYAGRDGVLVEGLPRGGVVVAAEVARALGAPLDVCLAHKLGVPGEEELAMGAIAEGGVWIINKELVRTLGITEKEIQMVVRKEEEEIQRRDKFYRTGRSAHPVEGRMVILVDDGLATGATMAAACLSMKRRGATRVAVAVPVAPPEHLSREGTGKPGGGSKASPGDLVRFEADEFVCLMTPEPFYAIGAWYDDFAQVSDQEVKALLA